MEQAPGHTDRSTTVISHLDSFLFLDRSTRLLHSGRVVLMHWEEAAKDQIPVHLGYPSLLRRQGPVRRRQSHDVCDDDTQEKTLNHFKRL